MTEINSNSKYGYRLGYYRLPDNRLKEVIVHIELVHSSHIVDERQHEIYDFLKTDLAKINKIESLNGEPITGEVVYLVKDPELKYDVKEGDIVRFKHSDFKEVRPDLTYIAFYTTRIGALNHASEVTSDFTGATLTFYPNGRIREKTYHANGVRTNIFGYYDSKFNSLHYTWTFEPGPPETVREYIYNHRENPIAQYIISGGNNGKIIKQIIYDKTDNSINSIYLGLTQTLTGSIVNTQSKIVARRQI